jgi:hypothetical protein
MPTLTMKVSFEEEEIILRRMRISGETNKSAHIKRIYFESRVSDDLAARDMGRKIDGLADSSRDVSNLLGRLVDMQKAPVGLTLAAATLLLLYPSVQPPVQAKIAKYIDMNGVEAILKGIAP